MNKKIITFEANEQSLIKTGGISNYSSNKVSYIEAEFELGENWQGFDAVRAIWYNKSEIIATVLSDGECTVPYEVLTDKGQVKVNLVGSISENDVLTDRLTTYPVVALIVDADAKVDGSNTQPITPSQFEQFVEEVKEDADRAEQGASDAETYANNAETSADNALLYSQNSEASAIRASGYALDAQGYAQNAETYASEAEDARDEIRNMSANATTLPSGSDATASYSDGVLSLGIPQGIQGEKGDNGDTGATPNLTIGTVTTLDPSESATATITGTDENPVLNLGLPKGEQGEVSLDELSALLPTDTASGDIASFSDGTDLFPALSVKAQIEPIQSGSGTPSPDNVRPISGHTECVTSVSGVNVWDEEWEVGTIVNATGADYPSTTAIRSDYIRVLPNTTYHMEYANANSATDAVFFYDSGKNHIAPRYEFSHGTSISVNFTTPSNCAFVRFKLNNTTSYTSGLSINYPSTDHDYHAYAGHDYTTDFGQTVYGGTLDVVSGELVVDRAYRSVTDMPTNSWNKLSSGSGAFYMARENAFPNMKYPYEAVNTSYPISDTYVYSPSGTQPNGAFRVSDALYIVDDRYSTISEFREAYAQNPFSFVYELATPQTYQLDPTEVDLLLGQNNVWTDCGSVEVTYKADVGLYIDKKLG